MNEELFLSKVKEHEGIINKILYLYVDTQEDKKDMYQEIVLQAWKSMSRFRGDSKFSTWLYRVGLNTVMTFNRKESRLQKQPLEDTFDIEQPSSEMSDRSLKLMQAVRLLNDIDKSIITLHLEDYNNDEIAEMIGITKNNVAVRIHRVKEELKRKLQANG
ncbi:RNA polymerase sigma factor [Fulvivirga lutea]|uniref:RNA polymerase sigma factor n=1 Tax=Fulvivirga lutea TaxID=2810512 RepID=A0A975A0J9_9BACT|nr:RNA polymerase sigma factor [Fulvivirga lutea]QSE97341.1 RNA polymerase sigma factor [Fulvivirga lutea]